jgi:hypothetical protein
MFIPLPRVQPVYPSPEDAAAFLVLGAVDLAARETLAQDVERPVGTARRP